MPPDLGQGILKVKTYILNVFSNFLMKYDNLIAISCGETGGGETNYLLSFSSKRSKSLEANNFTDPHKTSSSYIVKAFSKRDDIRKIELNEKKEYQDYEQLQNTYFSLYLTTRTG